MATRSSTTTTNGTTEGGKKTRTATVWDRFSASRKIASILDSLPGQERDAVLAFVSVPRQTTIPAVGQPDQDKA